MIFSCCDEHRKAAVLGNPTINGIDYLEVLDHQAPPGSPPQQTLFVYCLKTAPANLSPSNVLIEGGESITGITASWIAPASAPPPQASPAEAAYFRHPRQPGQYPGDPHQRRRRLFALHLAAGQQCGAGRGRCFRADRNADRVRSPAGRGDVFLQGRVRPEFRLQTQRRRLPAGTSAAAADQLSGQGLRLVSHRPARPPAPIAAVMAGFERGRSRGGAGRTDRLRGRPAELSPGRGDDRGLSRHGAQPHIAAPPRAAGRLSGA